LQDDRNLQVHAVVGRKPAPRIIMGVNKSGVQAIRERNKPALAKKKVERAILLETEQ